MSRVSKGHMHRQQSVHMCAAGPAFIRPNAFLCCRDLEVFVFIMSDWLSTSKAEGYSAGFIPVKELI